MKAKKPRLPLVALSDAIENLRAQISTDREATYQRVAKVEDHISTLEIILGFKRYGSGGYASETLKDLHDRLNNVEARCTSIEAGPNRLDLIKEKVQIGTPLLKEEITWLIAQVPA